MWMFIAIFIALFIIATIAISIFTNRSSNNKHDDYTYHYQPPLIDTDRDRREIESVGNAGESVVAVNLYAIATDYDGHLFNGYVFEDEDGFSTEIDHLLVTKAGIFVVETKSNKGTIEGNITDKSWVCIKKEYQDDKIFLNPVTQNEGHINHLSRMFKKGTTPKFRSIIIFLSADISNIDDKRVFNLREAVEYIRQVVKDGRYSEEFVESTYQQLLSIKEKYGITKERHIQNINNRYH